MALTPFQRRKIERLFETMDLNRDGMLERSDFRQRVDKLARLRGWDPDGPEYARNLEFAIESWQGVREFADVDDDARISRDEFLRYASIFLDDREAVRAYARGDAQLLFDAMDVDADGHITLEEYRTWLGICGLDATAADAFFAHADLDEDGRMTRAEMSHAIEEYLISDDPSAGGNYLFGPLEAQGAGGSV